MHKSQPCFLRTTQTRVRKFYSRTSLFGVAFSWRLQKGNVPEKLLRRAFSKDQRAYSEIIAFYIFGIRCNEDAKSTLPSYFTFSPELRNSMRQKSPLGFC